MRSSSIHVQNKTKQTNFEILILISIIFAQSIHNRFCYLILFYHLKKQFYQLYHTILQYTTSKNSIFFPFYLNILFYSFFFNFFFSLPFLLFLPQPLAPATTKQTITTTTLGPTKSHQNQKPKKKTKNKKQKTKIKPTKYPLQTQQTHSNPTNQTPATKPRNWPPCQHLQTPVSMLISTVLTSNHHAHLNHATSLATTPIQKSDSA